jgi:A/G-specific adenine glycosylase
LYENFKKNISKEFFFNTFRPMNKRWGGLLLQWYAQNMRTLPWRETKDPYKIWLSEIILQQTRVNQGLAYYNRFVKAFPDIFSLAAASAQKVYNLWQGLGYYNRADNLMKTAQIITSEYNGQFPDDFVTLKTLPGIGEYTAAAIASFAFDKPHAVVDGNVYRVLSRLFGIDTPIQTALAKKEFSRLAQNLMTGNPPAEFNQALMEFGALQCTSQPDCQPCPFRNVCFAYKAQRQREFPVKKKKAPQRRRIYYFFVFYLKQEGESYIYIKKRTRSDIWKNLYDFPSLQAEKLLAEPLDSLQLSTVFQSIAKESFTVGKPSPVYKQQLTHLLVSAYFIPFYLQKPLPATAENSLSLIPINQFTNYPVPRLIARYLQDYNIIK